MISKVVENFNLGKWVGQEAAREKLVMAGYRGQAPYITFLFFRMVTPILFLIGSVLYVFVISHMEKSVPVKIEASTTRTASKARPRAEHAA